MGSTEMGFQLEWRVTKACTGDLPWAKGRRQGMNPCRGWMGVEQRRPGRSSEEETGPRLPGPCRLSRPLRTSSHTQCLDKAAKKKHRHPGSHREEAGAGNRRRSVYSWQFNI